MPDSKEIRVFAPATVAIVACGYDVLGFAINAPGDEVVVTPRTFIASVSTHRDGDP